MSAGPAAWAAQGARPTRVGLVGVGKRGSVHLRNLVGMDVAIPAVCDVNADNLAAAVAVIEKAGAPKPEGYSRGEEDFRRLMAREDLDAVVIATPWEWHTPMAVAAMKSGKYPAVEVPIALTVEECWELVNTSEQTGVPCMMLENWSFRRDNLAVLNMIREGLLGEIVHCHCAHSHDCIHWYFDEKGNPRWPAKYLMKRNADLYPTHSVGPVLSWMDINCGDNFAYLTATASRSLGINDGLARRFGAGHPSAKQKYAQGDIITSLVKTHKGNTLVINNDMQLPRPYDNRWEIQGTRGLYNEQRSSVYLAGTSPKLETWEAFAPYQEKYDHAWWKAMRPAGAEGHGGTDKVEMRLFLEAVRMKSQTPIDVYDSVTMSVITPISEQSIADGSAPVPVPDFTRGKWRTRKPVFALQG